MPEPLYALALNLLETTFIFIVLLVLHHQRRTVGKAAINMVIGLLALFSYFVMAADLRVQLWGGHTYPVGEVMIHLPILAIYLAVYAVEGALTAQRMILGLTILFGLYLYIGELTSLQCNWLGFSINGGLGAATLDQLVTGSRREMYAAVFCHLLELFAAPMMYTRLKNFKLPELPALWGALAAAQLVSFLPKTVIRLGATGTWPGIDGEFIARALVNVWFAVLLAFYLYKMERDERSGERGPLDLLFAFVGSYGRSKELEEHLRENENRYHLMLQNSAEAVLMLQTDGSIIEANPAAGKLLHAEPETLTGKNLFERLRVISPENFSPAVVPQQPVRFRCELDSGTGNCRLLTASLTPMVMQGRKLLSFLGIDVTEEHRLAEERAALAEQLIHSQRLESLGKLAGGVAHDFNNCIHAILGHVDVAMLRSETMPPEIETHLQRIASLAEQSGKLTAQLLGFARRGKYTVVRLDMAQLCEDSLTMLGPKAVRDITLERSLPPGNWQMAGDAVQLRQVLVNLLLNAIDAMADTPPEQRKLRIALMEAADSPQGFTPPAEEQAHFAGEYFTIEISDTGCGIDDATKKHIFEPFFTTKPVGAGTGMGLAMVYGTVTHHHGWIRVRSTPGEGTGFFIYLPHWSAEDERSHGSRNA